MAKENVFKANSKILIIFVIIILLIVIINFIPSYGMYEIILIPVAGLLIFFGIKGMCPNCHKFFARKQINRERIGEDVRYVRADRTSRVEHDDGTIDRIIEPGRAPLKTRTYLYHYRCKKCGHEWQKTEKISERWIGEFTHP